MITVALSGYGLYRALYVPAMLVGQPVPLLVIGFLLQAVFGILAGIGVWRGARWVPLVVVVLGASIAATALIEGFVFGIVAYLRVLLEAVAAIAIALLIAVYVKRGLGAPETPMKPPRPVRAAPGSMAGMREKHLRQMLEQLHTELQRADTIDDRSRELLRSVLGDIEDLLERKQKRGTEPESIIEQLRVAVRAFETTHPTLTSAIGRVADALAGIGI